MSRSPVAFQGADMVGQRLQEIPALTAVQRVCMFLLLGSALLSVGGAQPWAWAAALLFGLSALVNLWRVLTGRGQSASSLRFYWSAAFIALLLARGTEGGAWLVVLFLYPLTMCTLLHGLRHGLSIAAFAAAAWWLDLSSLGLQPMGFWPGLALLAQPLMMAWAVKPMAALRQRVVLAAELERELDPRRGLVAVGLVVGERLRAATAAHRALVCHRDAEHPTVLVCDAEDGSFTASAALGGRVLALLDRLPAAPLAIKPRTGFIYMGQDKRHPAPEARPAAQALQELAQLLEADMLQLVPDAPDQARTAWMLLAFGPEPDPDARPWPLQTLAGFAGDMQRLFQQASYVDRLQAEIAAHERSRIGRDLHDSAIQPYLGLKFAIEGLALRSDPANPLHRPIEELRAVCDAELLELRKTVSSLRTGTPGGENSLGAALQRQCNRYARLFDIQVDLQVPDELPVSGTVAGAVLHMVNEALNNVRRHTQAKRVWVSLVKQTDALQLLIRDDAGQRAGKAVPAFEPRSLTERARELGGALELRLHNQLDTEVLITLPQ